MGNLNTQNGHSDTAGQKFVAHVRASDGSEQSLYDHLTGTAEIAKTLATKIGLPLSGELIGLVHDLGKYSQVTPAVNPVELNLGDFSYAA